MTPAQLLARAEQEEREAGHWPYLHSEHVRRVYAARVLREEADAIAALPSLDTPCPHPERRGNHEHYQDSAREWCRACGATRSKKP